MIARSRLVRNFLSHCAVSHRQLTRVIGLKQSVRLHSTNDNPDKNFTLKLPPNATGVSVEHSNKKSLDGTSLRVTLNISVRQSDTRASEFQQSRKQPENLTRSLGDNTNKNLTEKTNQIFVSAPAPYDLLRDTETKNQSQLLEVLRHEKNEKMIIVRGISKEITQYDLCAYFSRFGRVDTCFTSTIRDCTSGYVGFKSPKIVNHVLNCGPYYLIGDGIGNTDYLEMDMQAKEYWRDIQEQDVCVFEAHPDREFTLVIGNLSPITTGKTLKDHFSKYGQLTQSEVKIDRQTGQSRGFGYVAFSSKEELDRALNDHHVIHRADVYVNRRSSELDLKIDSLAHISEELLEKTLCDFFSRYGRVRDFQFIKNFDKSTTAFVQLSSKDEVSQALAGRPHWINGQMIDTHQKGEEFKLFVSGLPNNMIDDDLYETFSKFGKIVHWQVKRRSYWRTNGSRDFGYVAFSSAEELDRAMKAGPHCINGKLIDTHETREELVSTHVKDEVFAMYVIGLSENTTDEDIYQTFSKVGTLMECEVIRDWETNRSLRYAYVSFSTAEELANALEKNEYWINSQRVTVKPKKDTPILDDDNESDDCSDDDDANDSDDGDKDIDDDEPELSFCDNTILVKNLPKSATDEKLEEIFSEFGQLTDWGVKSDGSYGWVSFERPIKVGTLEDKSPTMFGKILDLKPVKSAAKEFEDFQKKWKKLYGHKW